MTPAAEPDKKRSNTDVSRFPLVKLVLSFNLNKKINKLGQN